MRRRGFTVLEIVVICIIGCILWAILWPVFNRPKSFTSTSIPAMRYQNVELQAVLADLYSMIRRQRGSRVNYSQHFQWENNDLKTRRVWFETKTNLPLQDIFQRLEKAAQIKFDRVERPYHSTSLGKYSIRDAKQKSPHKK